MKALKIKRGRRGRPRTEQAIREPSGRISRKHKEPPSKLALEARARMTGLSIERAHDQQAGQWLGRLHMAYQTWYKQERGADKPQPVQSISTGQYHALLTYQTLHNNYLKAVGAPGAVYDGGGAGLGDEDAAETWARFAKQKYTSARKAVEEADKTPGVDLWPALDYCVIREHQAPHMIGDLRVLANALATHFNGKARG